MAAANPEGLSVGMSWHTGIQGAGDPEGTGRKEQAGLPVWHTGRAHGRQASQRCCNRDTHPFMVL